MAAPRVILDTNVDDEDYHLIAASIIADVDYLVTANTKDFPPYTMFANTTVVTPEAFIDILATAKDVQEQLDEC